MSFVDMERGESACCDPSPFPCDSPESDVYETDEAFSRTRGTSGPKDPGPADDGTEPALDTSDPEEPDRGGNFMSLDLGLEGLCGSPTFWAGGKKKSVHDGSVLRLRSVGALGGSMGVGAHD